MHTLALSGGDLVATSAGHAIVDGSSMIRQNMALALGEPVGTDRFHPAWGSTLDAQTGTPGTDAALLGLRAEAMRVVSALIAAQGAAIAADAAAGRRSRFGSADIISRLVDVQVSQDLDAAQVYVQVATAAGDAVGIASQVGA